MGKAVAAATVALALAACAGTDFAWSQARQLRAGMTPAEVEALMGRPYMVTVRGDQTVWVWSHVNALGSARTLSVVFKGGALTEAPTIPDTF